MIKLENVYKSFGDLEVLKDINLEVRAKEVVCVIGPSGSGKSTMLRCLNQLERITSGKIFIDGELADEREMGKDLKAIPPEKVQQLCTELGMVFQRFNLFPHLTVMENITIAPQIVRKQNIEEINKIAQPLLALVGLEDKKDEYPSRLSGGQQQRVAIARALAMQPKIMLFDEPTSALDPELVGEVLEVIKKLAENGMTMIVVTHEMGFARSRNLGYFYGRRTNHRRRRSKSIFDHPKEERTKAFLKKIL